MASPSLAIDDIVLFPHCDLHLALTGAPELALRVMRRRSDPESPTRYEMEPVLFTDLVFSFLAPYEQTGHRLDHLPTVRRGENETTAVVTATVAGSYLFQVRTGDHYMVGRLQVHNSIVAWWFGIDSITTAKDDVAHAQPSIYAKFSDDPVDRAAGTDLIGDITGHGYVELNSTDETVFTITATDRLLGFKETAPAATPAQLPKVTGKFLNQTAEIPVRVVDYARARTDLKAVGAPGFAQAKDKHNILFLPEGFRAQDEALFHKIVEHVRQEMFTKQRHEPYGLLKDSFNVFKYFVPSQERTLTPAFRVLDAPGPPRPNGQPFPPEGAPVPLEDQVDDSPYSVAQLVAFVGLPPRGETREPTVLRELWRGQGLSPGVRPEREFNPDLAHDELIRIWRTRSEGILQARDTFFGLQLGRRLADRASGLSTIHLDLPPQDGASMHMRLFLRRLYEFFEPQDVAQREIRNDPRRHPPELYALVSQRAVGEVTNPNNAVTRFFGGLQFTVGTRSFPIGQEWVPRDTQFQRSRGLVAVIALEDFHSGRNINNSSMTAQSTSGKTILSIAYDNPQDRRVLRRKIDDVAVDLDDVVNKATHEFGHSLNLGDEYEIFPNSSPTDPAGAIDVDPVEFDNVMILGTIRPRPPLGLTAATAAIDPDRVKWINLPRMVLSSRLVAPSEAVDGGMRIAVDPKDLGQWVQARADNPELLVSLRAFEIFGLPNRQLPLGQLMEGLSIVGEIDESAGLITLAGAALPNPAPVLETGSVLFVPLGNNDGVPLVATDRRVLAHLRSTLQPLNPDKDKAKPSNDPEKPVSIDGFSGPCKSYRTVGIYEGALSFAGGRYRPTGACKMRNSATDAVAGPDLGTLKNPTGRKPNSIKADGAEFCFVCKWLIVNRVDPSMHRILTEKFYPTAKSSEDD